MTGPEHYTSAEKILAQFEGQDKPVEIVAAAAAAAQVHATLALAAATASGTMNRAEWFAATLTVPADPNSGVIRA